MQVTILVLVQLLASIVAADTYLAAYYANGSPVFNSSDSPFSFPEPGWTIISNFSYSTQLSAGALSFPAATVIRPIDKVSNSWASLVNGKNVTSMTVYNYGPLPSNPSAPNQLFSKLRLFGVTVAKQVVAFSWDVPRGSETVTLSFKAIEVLYFDWNSTTGNTLMSDLCFATAGAKCAV